MKNIKILLIIFIAISLSLSGCFLIDSIIPNANDNGSVSESDGSDSENNGSDSEEDSSNSVSNDTNSGSTTTGNVDEIIASGDYVKQEILVKVKPSTNPDDIAEMINGEIIELLPDISLVRILLPVDLDMKEAIGILNQNKSVEYVEPNGICSMHLTPDDTYYDSQWAPQLTNAEEVWEKSVTGSGVTIAITDTGVDGTHEDLTNRVIAGRDTYNNEPIAPNVDSAIHPHGTHCAGIAAAAGDNGKGIAGVAWESDIMPIRMSMDDNPDYASWADMAEAFMWAANNGADIISCSFGGKFYSQAMKDAVDFAVGSGCTMFASMGNSSVNEVQYPAGYQSVIAVGATNAHDEIANFSTTGSHMSICAPGVEIYSTVTDNGYAYMSGTSMACPFAAGVAALMLSADTSLSQYDIKTRLENSAVDLGISGFDSTYGYGRVNVEAAVNNSDSSDYGSIDVLITDSEDLPLSGVSVILWLAEEVISTTESNNDGHAIFKYIPAGDYGISASLTCFEPSPASDNTVTVTSGGEVSKTIAFSTALEVKPKITNVEGIAITRKLDESSSADSNYLNSKRFEDRLAVLVEKGILKEKVNYENVSDISLPKGTNDIEYLVDITWPTYQDAKGYIVYRSTDDSEYIQILNWEEPYTYTGEGWLGFYDYVSSPDSTYKYYVIVFGDCWKTEESDIITVDTFLPPCSLISPEDESTINEPTPVFTWNPVGLSDFSSSSIVGGYSDLWVYDNTSGSSAWYPWFDDMTTSSVTYNDDGNAATLVSGHNYVWDSWGYGYDENEDLIAMSWSEDWDFTVDIEGSTVRRALLVGVGDYISDNVQDLLAPPYDVDMMRDTLEHSGVESTLIDELKDQQATKNAILSEIAIAFSGADSDDVSYFYFSGHGTNPDGTSYLVPTDAGDLNDCISVNELEAALSEIQETR
jgi:thermitase